MPEKNKAAQELGRLGGSKGGKARAANMTPEERSEAARKAVNARWEKWAARAAAERIFVARVMAEFQPTVVAFVKNNELEGEIPL